MIVGVDFMRKNALHHRGAIECIVLGAKRNARETACRRIVDATVSGVRFSHSGTARTSYPEFNDLVYRNRSHSESVSSRSSSDMYAEGRLKLRPKTPNTDSVFFF